MTPRDADLIGNRFSALDSDWSSTASQSITPTKSSLTSTASNPGDSNAHSASLSLYLPSIPATTPASSLPIVKLPGSVSHNESRGVYPGLESQRPATNDAFTAPCNAFVFPPIPSPFLYHNDSRELLLGIQEGNPSPTKPGFKSCKVDAQPFISGSCRATADDGPSQPVINHDPIFIAAALPDMSKAAPITTPAFDFYKHTRCYLPPSKKIAVGRSGNEQLTNSKTSATFPKWLRTMTDIFPRTFPRGTRHTPPSKTSHEPGAASDRSGLWEQPPTSLYDSIYPELKPATGSKTSPATDGYIQRLTDFRDSSCGSHPAKADWAPLGTFPCPSKHEAGFDTNTAMASFEKVMNKESTMQANEGRLTRLLILPNSRHHSPIRDAATRSAVDPGIPFESAKTIASATCPASVCGALVPTTMYEHQYLGWPRCVRGEDLQYEEKAWLTVGVYVAQLPKEEINQSVELVPEKLRERQFLPTPTTGEVATREWFAYGAVAGDDVPLPFFDATVKTPDSEADWSEIGGQSGSECDWDWSEDDVGA